MATFLDPRPTIFDSAGVRVLSGRVWFYEAGTVNTLKAIYSDHLLTSPMTNPVPLDASGRVPQIYYEAGSYKVKVQKQTGFLPFPNDIWQDVWTTDWVDGGDVVATLGNFGNMVYALNLSTLRGIDPTVAPVVMVLGNTNTGDGGGGVYQWAGSVSTPDDNGIYIQRDLGGTGRFIRMVEPCASEMSIRIWCGDSTSVIDSALSAGFSYCAMNRIPLSFPTGKYKLSGDTAFSSSNLSIIIHQGAYFSIPTIGFLSFSCPTIIDSVLPITDNTVSLLYFDESTRLSKLDYDWFKGMTDIAYSSGIPLYIDSQIEVLTASPKYFSFSPVIVGPSAYFLMNDSSIIGFPNGFSVEGLQERKLFYGNEFNVQYPHSIGSIQAEWYGVGIDSGNQSVQFTTAMTDAHVYNLDLIVPATTYSGTVSLADIKIRATGVITLASTASLSNIYLLNPLGKPVFSCSSGSNLYIVNPTVCPEWYGAISGTSDNSIPLRIMLNNAGLTGAQITGRNLPYAYINPIAISGLYGKMRMKDIVLNYTPNTGVALTLSHTPSWENVKITCTNWSIVSLSCPSMIEDGFMRDCSFYGKGIRLSSRDTSTFVASFDFDNCTVDGLDPSVVFSNCHSNYNIDVHDSRFIGNASVAIANQFTDSFASIQNINFHHNFVDTRGGSADGLGGIFVVSQKASTIVNGVSICENGIACTDTFAGEKIVSSYSGSGSWFSETTFSQIHRISVYDNALVSGGVTTIVNLLTTRGISKSERNVTFISTSPMYTVCNTGFNNDSFGSPLILLSNAFTLATPGGTARIKYSGTASDPGLGTGVVETMSLTSRSDSFLDVNSKRVPFTWMALAYGTPYVANTWFFTIYAAFEVYPS